MRLLVDTHALLWWASGDPRLSKTARALIGDPKNELLVSAAVLWEISIKASLGRLVLGGTPADFADRLTSTFGMILLAIRAEHALGVYDLPPHHQDPFDRLLVAQARIEGVPLITHDPKMGLYAVAVEW